MKIKILCAPAARVSLLLTLAAMLAGCDACARGGPDEALSDLLPPSASMAAPAPVAAQPAGGPAVRARHSTRLWWRVSTGALGGAA
ncbi:MAG TPA: hypothetical protein VJN44_21395 [Roseateles sp.]|nr:hypothetical protein [Roseateles sp.]